MKAAIIALSLVCAVLAFYADRQADRIARVESSIAELGRKSSEFSKAEEFNLRARCSEQARKAFGEMGYSKNDVAGYENHYNKAFNRCFIFVNSIKTEAGKVTQVRSLFDAFEGKEYGSFILQAETRGSAPEAAPLQCDFTFPSGEQKHCQSAREFSELLKLYMQDK
jgi:hypothetical protein